MLFGPLFSTANDRSLLFIFLVFPGSLPGGHRHAPNGSGSGHAISNLLLFALFQQISVTLGYEKKKHLRADE
jgi:hypothetical protein